MATLAPITGQRARAPLAIAASLDRMIAVQVAGYPDHWTDAEKRETAERHLFGSAGR